jgi:hypothetical protein
MSERSERIGVAVRFAHWCTIAGTVVTGRLKRMVHQ